MNPLHVIVGFRFGGVGNGKRDFFFLIFYSRIGTAIGRRNMGEIVDIGRRLQPIDSTASSQSILVCFGWIKRRKKVRQKKSKEEEEED